MWASMKFLPGGTDMKVWGPILGNALPYCGRPAEPAILISTLVSNACAAVI